MIQDVINTMGDLWESRLLISIIIYIIFVSTVIYVGYRVIKWLLPSLLWFEFQVTNRLRLAGKHPLPGSYFYDDVVVWMMKNFRRMATLVWLFFVFLGLVTFREQVHSFSLMQQAINFGEPYLDLVDNQINSFQRQMNKTLEETETSPTSPETNDNNSDSNISNSKNNESDVAENEPRPTSTIAKPTATSRSVTSEEKVENEVYVIEEGDSLFNIALDYGVSIEAIVEANKEKYPSLEKDQRLLGIGWELNIPQN